MKKKKNINKNEENTEKEDENNNLDYKGNEINLNELIFDESESVEHELLEKKSQLKLAFTRVKNIRRFKKLKSLNYNNKKIIFSENNSRKAKQKKTVVQRSLKLNHMNESSEEDQPNNGGRLETIMTENDFESSNKLLTLNLNIKKDNYKNDKAFLYDETYLYELLYRLLD